VFVHCVYLLIFFKGIPHFVQLFDSVLTSLSECHLLISVLFDQITPRLKELSIFKAQQEAKIESSSALTDHSNANDSSHKRKTSKMANRQEPLAKRRKENAPKSTVSSDDQGSKAQTRNVGAVEVGEVSGKKANESTDVKIDTDTQAGNARNESKPYFYDDKCTAYVSNIDFTVCNFPFLRCE
jgi:squamous cell carcinoma antigen recognized by T-cells 3